MIDIATIHICIDGRHYQPGDSVMDAPAATRSMLISQGYARQADAATTTPPEPATTPAPAPQPVDPPPADETAALLSDTPPPIDDDQTDDAQIDDAPEPPAQSAPQPDDAQPTLSTDDAREAFETLDLDTFLPDNALTPDAPTLAPDLIAKLRDAGINTVGDALRYREAHKNFTPLKGIGTASSARIMAALDSLVGNDQTQ